MGNKIKLSVIILESDQVDSELYKKSLSSVSFADEIVKVDTKLVKGGFSEWRNEGLKRSTGEWVLYVDMDEVITDELKMEIQSWIAASTFPAFAIPRRNFIFNKEFKHSGQYPDYQKRLFLRKRFHNWKGNLHEEPVFEGILGYLKQPILHYKNITLAQMVDKTNKWSEIEAQLLFDAGHPRMNIFRFATVAMREFFKRMLKEAAFLDGKEGVIYAMYQVYSRLITYSKLWEKQLL